MKPFMGFLFGDDFSVLDDLGYKDVNRQVEPYIYEPREQALKTAWLILRSKDMEKELAKIKTDEDALQWYADFILEGLDKDGNIISTRNRDLKHCYQIGGQTEYFLCIGRGCYVIETMVGLVEWERTRLPPCYVTPEGEWQQKGEMSEEEWETQFRAYVATLPFSTDVTVILFNPYH